LDFGAVWSSAGFAIGAGIRKAIVHGIAIVQIIDNVTVVYLVFYFSFWYHK
jgi:hypothetical protein